jgi:hypothetical protein
MNMNKTQLINKWLINFLNSQISLQNTIKTLKVITNFVENQ